MKVAFLVYDSRSGSTLFSRELSARFGDVFVTPEIGFDTLLRMDDAMLRKQGWPSTLLRMYQGHEFINLKIPYERVLGLVEPKEGALTISDGIKAILHEYARENGMADCQWIVVKNGSHLRYWRVIQKLFKNEIPLIHVVRDPRAVVNSKLRTARPYYPGEVMAWGGVFLASIRWKQYVAGIEEARAAGMNICEIRYEDLVDDIGTVMELVSGFLKLASEVSGVSYSVPEREKSIHKLVLSSGFERERTEAWANELLTWDRLKVEAVCGKEMKKLGYPISGRSGESLLRWIACLSDIPSMLIKTCRHYLRVYRRIPIGAKHQSGK